MPSGSGVGLGVGGWNEPEKHELERAYRLTDAFLRWFTALLHHVTIDLLKEAYSWLNGGGAGSRRNLLMNRFFDRMLS